MISWICYWHWRDEQWYFLTRRVVIYQLIRTSPHNLLTNDFIFVSIVYCLKTKGVGVEGEGLQHSSLNHNRDRLPPCRTAQVRTTLYRILACRALQWYSMDYICNDRCVLVSASYITITNPD
jgi:hypothetical protein